MFRDEMGRSAFLNAGRPTCSAFALHDWSEDDYIRGTYSSPSVGAGWMSQTQSEHVPTEATTPALRSSDALPPMAAETCRHGLAKPLQNTLFFAGEHTNVKNVPLCRPPWKVATWQQRT
mmetsp:Transcript_9794/g.10855  ORF Transcript_9794/g.10855 Transcript_9794/m.10855 type:complete len:119 (-) Transcript_9794:126-482(-)